MKPKRRAPPPLRRYQARISLDEGMGPIFEWIQQVPAGVRPREMTNLVRLGFSVACGIPPGGVVLPSTKVGIATPLAGAAGSKQSPEESMEHDQRCLDGWDIEGMLQGPPPAA